MFSVRETSSDQLNNFTYTFFSKLHTFTSVTAISDSLILVKIAHAQNFRIFNTHGFATFSLKNVQALYLALVGIELKAFPTEAYRIGRGKSSYQGTFLGFLQWNRER